eukprot:TRINITY_DN19536_c0_g1_i1.p1 TRINITY_DN19536_c0_g1~~TRINITY_DN19536_c0_g1_i1.p1  ORF type:complete len:409 (+),score=155.98 TRINITY_DN19536_c0_g1_i1:61-1227(+)
MPALPAFLATYDTMSVVRIHNSRLGTLNFILNVLCAIYIVFVPVLYSQGYVEKQGVTGELDFKMGGTETDPNYNLFVNMSQPYCGSPAYYGDNYTCHDAITEQVIVPISGNTIGYALGGFLYNMTHRRINETYLRPIRDDYTATTSYWLFPDAELYQFRLRMLWNFNGADNGTNFDVPGELVDLHGGAVRTYQKVSTDTFTNATVLHEHTPAFSLQLLMQAAGMDSLDVPSDIMATENYRTRGLSLVANIEYSNQAKFGLFQFPGDLRWTMSVRHVPKTFWEAYYVPDNWALDRFLKVKRKGVSITFQQTGEYVYFSFQVLFITVVTGVALFSLSKIILDTIFFSPKATLWHEKFAEVEVRQRNLGTLLMGSQHDENDKETGLLVPTP